jgi:hypothetical protein
VRVTGYRPCLNFSDVPVNGIADIQVMRIEEIENGLRVLLGLDIHEPRPADDIIGSGFDFVEDVHPEPRGHDAEEVIAENLLNNVAHIVTILKG